MKPESTRSLEAALGHTFQRRELLQQALTHSSHAREAGEGVPDNEQMEFLGDAVLNLVTSEELYARFPQYKEGELSKLRAHLVSARHLVNIADGIGLGEYLRLGRGEEKTGGRAKAALLVDALEALLAAMYLDAGLARAREFILGTIVRPELERLSAAGDDDLVLADYKSRLQERLHVAGRPEPEYEAVKEEGPEHRKTFTVAVVVRRPGGEVDFRCEGEGASKKVAGQEAAQKAIKKLAEGHKS